MAQQTQVNGNRYSFTNITVEASLPDGSLYELPRGIFKSINYSAKQDPGIVQGNQITIVGRTTGYGTGDGAFEMLVSEWDDFVDALSFSGTFPIMSLDFDIIIAYSVNDVDTRVDTLQGCRITSIESNNQQGNDATTKMCNINIARINMNGIDAFGDPIF